MTLNYILIEDGVSHILLEDNSGLIMLENQPGSSSIIFTNPSIGSLRGTARSSMSSSIVFSSTSNIRANARTLGSSSIILNVNGKSLGGSIRTTGVSNLFFIVLSKTLGYTLRPYDPFSFPVGSPIVPNTSGIDNLYLNTTYVSPYPPYIKN